MKIEPLTQSACIQICRHMNDDHQDALIQYAKCYAGIVTAKKAKMIELSPIAMTLKIDKEIIEISFDHKLVDRADAHRTLVAMLKNTDQTREYQMESKT